VLKTPASEANSADTTNKGCPWVFPIPNPTSHTSFRNTAGRRGWARVLRWKDSVTLDANHETIHG
jgi:hypothetical protein